MPPDDESTADTDTEPCPACGEPARVPEPSIALRGGGSVAAETDCDHVVVFRFDDEGESYAVDTL